MKTVLSVRLTKLLGCVATCSALLVACTGDDDYLGDPAAPGSDASMPDGSSPDGSNPDASVPDGEVAAVNVLVDGFCLGICTETEVGQQITLRAEVLDAAGELLDVPVTWESEAASVASVDAQGLVTGLGVGMAPVVARAGGVTGRIELSVLPSAVVRVEISPAHVDLTAVGDTATYTAKAYNRLDELVPDVGFTWYVSDPESASIDASGKLTSLGQGHVIVQAGTATAGGWASATVVSPIASRPAMRFDQVSGGAHHGCGVRASKAYCWGWNYYGQLGSGEPGSLEGVPVAQPVAGNHAFVSVSAGEYHSCGITAAGAAYCWGAGGGGELGNGNQQVLGSPVPLPVVGNHVFRQLAAGGSHTCGIVTSGDLYCWGSNFEKALGIAGDGRFFSPQQVTPGVKYTDVVAGLGHTCGLREDHTVYCWGANLSGALGIGDAAEYNAPPTAIAGDHHFTSIDSYGTHTCGVEDDTSIWCWGRNDTGQAGNGESVDNAAPVKLLSDASFVQVTTGAHHTCGLTSTGETWCAGDGAYGQLGGGALDFSNRVKKVIGGLQFVDLEAGSHFTCGRLAGAETYCWGTSESGQLGGGHAGPEIVGSVPTPMRVVP